MTEHEEGFTSAMLDEQLEHPLEHLSPAEVRLVDALYKDYHETWERSAAVLDHAWERIVQNQYIQPTQTHLFWHIPVFARRNKQLKRIASMPKKQKSKLTVLFSTLAAIILIVLVAGGLVLVQQNQQAHMQPGGKRTVSTSPKATPSPASARMFGKTIYTAPGDWGGDITWSPDSTRIAAWNNGEIQIWDATTGGNLLKITLPNVYQLAWSPNSQLIAVNTNQQILFVNGQTGAIVAHFTPQATALSATGTNNFALSATLPVSGDGLLGGLAWSPNGRFLATEGANPTTGAQQILILNVQSNQIAYTIPMAGYNLGDFSFSPDSQYLAASLGDQTVPTPANSDLTQVWKIATNQIVFKHPGGGSLAWQPGSHNLVYVRFSPKKEGGSTATLEFWNVLANRELNHYAGNAFGPIIWSPDGQYLAYASAGTVTTNAIVILNPTSGQQVYAYKGSNQSGEGFLALAWSPNGKYIASEQENNKPSTKPASPGGVITYTKTSDAYLIEVWTAI